MSIRMHDYDADDYESEEYMNASDFVRDEEEFKFSDHDNHDIGWVRHLYHDQAENTIWLRCDTCNKSYEFVATTTKEN